MTLEEKMDEIREEAREEGIEEGIEKGIEKGIKERSLEVAKAMRYKGYDISDIIELTKLTKEEIESL